MSRPYDQTLRIIERGPWESARERYRQLASEDRPGDPLDLPAKKGWTQIDYDCACALVITIIVAVASAFAFGVA